jgi:ATP-dependent DNA helicase PIF1
MDTFSEEQQIVFNKYIQKQNIFITGPGGTGKSFIIKFIQQDAYKKCIDLHVCALTGCAAVLLNCKAKTLHSWAGIGLGSGTIENNIKKVQKHSLAKMMWKNTDILIVDEVSMMSQKLFEMLDAIGKKIRRNSKPFGGIQLIFSGDFYQLPPVGNKDEPETCRFCFESPLWFATFPYENHVQLTKIYRQSDELYQRILNQIREGIIKRSSNERLLENVGREVSLESIIRPTKLYPTRNKADYVNQEEMNKLVHEEEKLFNLKYHTDLPMTNKEKILRTQFTKDQIDLELKYLKSNLRCDETVKLKKGAQVMCIVNMELASGSSLCNGSQGVIIDFQEQGLPVVKYNNGIQLTMPYNIWPSENIPGVGVSQIPLILAWALTIHKAQGATLDTAEVDVGSGIFECGQTYVALSRVKSLEGLYLSSFDARRIKINGKAQEFYEKLKEEKINKQHLDYVPPIEEEKEEKEDFIFPIQDETIKVIKLN